MISSVRNFLYKVYVTSYMQKLVHRTKMMIPDSMRTIGIIYSGRSLIKHKE